MRDESITNDENCSDGWELRKLYNEIELCYGKSLPEKDRVHGNFPVFGSNGIIGYHNEYLVDGPGIIVGRKGSVGEVVYSEKNFWPIDTTYFVKLKRGGDIRFWYYFLKTQKLSRMNTHSAVPGLNRNQVYDLKACIPPILEQKSIASILSSLDDKIELNQRMNKTLEAIAQAIFKHWFVDFEFSNEEGKPYKSSGGEMVYNEELGKEIPKGWEIHSLSDIAQVVDCLHSKKPSQQKTGHILLQVYNIGESGELDLSQPYYIDDKDYALWTSRIKIRGGDIIISKTGRVGALAQIPKGFEGAIGRNLVCIRCLNNRIGNGYLKEYMLSSLMKKEISIRTLTGTVLQSLHVKEIEKLRVLIPSQEIASKFEKIASPIHDKINKNIAESLELSQIRDTLLPKLMSGEIRVKVDEVENEVRDETVG